MMLYHFIESLTFFAQANETIDTTIDTICVARHWELGIFAIKFVTIHGACLLVTGLIYRI